MTSDKPIPKNHRPLPLHSKKIFEGKRWNIHQWEQKQFDGSTKTYESISIFDGVIIYPIIDGKVMILEEEQAHWGHKNHSTVGGGVEPGENIFDAAKRELFEETGMTFENLYLVDAEQISPDIHATHYVFVANGAYTQSKERNPDVGEKTNPKIISIDELVEMNRKREFYYRPAFLDNYMIQDNTDTLFDIFRHPEKYQIL